MNRQFYVYIITNLKTKPIYIGVTKDLCRRIYEHKNKVADSYSSKYNLTKLVYFEVFNFINDAITREKQLKNWHRDWKLNLIKTVNPELKEINVS
ncbi:MAG: GIY-YIG nuclease family protein [Candidatus Gastranaerophilales bacterium]|nr:GIY-YIG nuclease family protein [Candidatus Gastranaerophilales bacterium]